MGDLISREAVWKLLNIEHPLGFNNDDIAEAFRNAPAVDAVPREEHEALLRRFRHLLKSDFIRSFDEYDQKTGTYKRDIAKADKTKPVRRGKWILYDVREYADGLQIPEYKCSICGRIECIEEPYCHCGAKMDKEG